MKFLRNLLASILGSFIILICFLFFFVTAVTVSNDEWEVVIKQNSVLKIDLQNPIKDYVPEDDLYIKSLLGLEKEELGIMSILNAIEFAKNDNKILGISLDMSSVSAGISQLKEIRSKLEDFKSSGKFITAYADDYSQSMYYLSTVADSLYLNPVGSADLKGLSYPLLFYKDFEDKYGVKIEVIRHGEYKSAAEPFMYNKMSSENRDQITAFIGTIWKSISSQMASSRKIPENKFQNLVDNFVGRNAKLAISHNIVDRLIYRDQYRDILKNTYNVNNVISLTSYIRKSREQYISFKGNKVAVIYAQGEIVYGKGSEDEIGNQTMEKAILDVENNDAIKAVVIRVNSPGGSAVSSELIWRAIEKLKEKKPVVVSMGNLAASGGYYISCGADKIFAEPTTITGSIGVIGMLPNVKELANNLGINEDRVSTNKSPYYSPFTDLSDDFKTVTKEGIESIYNIFLERVSKGRNMTVEQIDKIARGRVWAGADALDIGLVDQLGGLDQAIEAAVNMANISSYNIVDYPKFNSRLELYPELLPLSKMRELLLKEELGPALYKNYSQIKQVLKLEGIQARAPFILDTQWRL